MYTPVHYFTYVDLSLLSFSDFSVGGEGHTNKIRNSFQKKSLCNGNQVWFKTKEYFIIPSQLHKCQNKLNKKKYALLGDKIFTSDKLLIYMFPQSPFVCTALHLNYNILQFFKFLLITITLEVSFTPLCPPTHPRTPSPKC